MHGSGGIASTSAFAPALQHRQVASFKLFQPAQPVRPDNPAVDIPDYDPRVDTPPLSDAELAALDVQLQDLPVDNPMNIEALDGYLTGLLLGPGGPARWRSAQWMPVVWGLDPDGAAPGDSAAPFSSQKQRKKAIVAVLRHLGAIHRQLKQAPQAWEPVFSVAEQGEDELVDAEEWCIGFLQAVALCPDDWAPVFDDAELGPALVPVALLGAEDSGLSPTDLQRLADPAERDALSRAVADGVLLLAGRVLG